MKPKYLYIPLLLSLFLSTIQFAQTPKIDSLKLELKAYPKKDTTRVKLLNKIAIGSYGLNNNEMKEYANKANDLAKEIGFIKGEALSQHFRGLYYFNKGEIDSSLVELEESLVLFEQIEDNTGKANSYDIIAMIFNKKEDFESTILYYNKALNLYKAEENERSQAIVLMKMGHILQDMGEFEKGENALKESIALFKHLTDIEGVSKALNNLGLIYTRQDRHREALNCFQTRLKIYRASGDSMNKSGILMNMALIYSAMDQNEKALPYLEEGLEIAKKLGDQLLISKYQVGIGYVYRFNKDYDKALEYYNEALIICEAIDSKEGLYNCYQNIGGLYIDKEEFQSALIYFEKALKAGLFLSSDNRVAESHTELGLIYFELGDHKKAFKNATKGLEIANEISLLRTEMEANRVLYMLYEKENNYQEAFERHMEFKILSDSLYNKEKTEKITSLEYEFKYQQELDSARIRELSLTKSVETTELELKETEQNFLWAVIAFLIALILLGSIIIFLRFRNIKSKTKNIIMEQKLLRSQMTPHFMFNSLAVLQGMILSKEDEKSIKYLSKFSTLLRTTLENSRNKTVSLAQELNAVENYLALQVLHNSAYEYQIKIEDNIDVNSLEIPVMLIQPFAENAIEHAFTESLNKQLVEIGVYFKNNALICTITDNGVGIDTQEKVLRKDKKSLATAITSERLKILSKSFKMKGSITIEDRKKYNENGTLVTIEIPYKLEK